MTSKDNKTADKLHVKANYDPKTKIAIASTDVVDRHGEVINQDGWDLSNYIANPVLLWAHDNYEPAVGSGNNPRVTQIGADKKGLVFEPKFHGLTDLSKALDILYNGDETHAPVLNSFSVGFRPTEQDGDTYLKNELLEISGVNVPANPDAQMLAYKTLSENGFERKTIESLGISTKVLDKLTKLEKDVASLQQLVKGKIPPAPKAQVLNKRQMMAKAISKATDLLLEGDKHNSLSTHQRKSLVKIIKRASEKISTSQKEQING